MIWDDQDTDTLDYTPPTWLVVIVCAVCLAQILPALDHSMRWLEHGVSLVTP